MCSVIPCTMPHHSVFFEVKMCLLTLWYVCCISGYVLQSTDTAFIVKMCWWIGVFCDTLMCVLHQCCACSLCVCCAACIILLTCATSYAYARCALNVSTYSEHTLCICVSFLEINILMDNNSLLRNKKDCDQFSWKTHTKSGTYKRFEIGATKWPNLALLAQESLWNKRMTKSGMVLLQASLPCVFVVALCLWPPTPSAWPAPVSPPHRHTPRPEPQRDNVMHHIVAQQPCPHSTTMSSLNNHVLTQQSHLKAWTIEGQCYAPHHHSTTMSSLNNHVLTQQPRPHSTTTPQGLDHRGTMLCVMLSLNNHVLTQQLHLKA